MQRKTPTGLVVRVEKDGKGKSRHDLGPVPALIVIDSATLYKALSVLTDAGIDILTASQSKPFVWDKSGTVGYQAFSNATIGTLGASFQLSVYMTDSRDWPTV